MYARPIWSNERSSDAVLAVLFERPCSSDDLVHAIQACPAGEMGTHLAALISEGLISMNNTRPAIYTINKKVGARIVIGKPPVSWVNENREHFVRGKR